MMFNIQKVANIEDDTSSDAFEVFQFITVDGDTRHIKIDRGQSRNLKYVYRALLRANAALPADDDEARRLVQQAIDAETTKRLHYATRLGWEKKYSGFMLWNEFIGTQATGGKVLAPPWSETFSSDHVKTMGTLTGWRKFVAKPAARSSRLVFLAAAAFAAPVSRFRSAANIGFNLSGFNHVDSEIAAAFVGSILGCDSREIVSDWGIKPSRLLGRARLFEDQLFLAGNVVGSAERMEAGRQHERLIALRCGKAHREQDEALRGDQQPTPWRGIFITLLPFPVGGSAMAGIDDIAGTLCIDIPPASTLSALLDLPRSSAADADLTPTMRAGQRIAASAERNRGQPMRRYVRYLVKHRVHLPAKIATFNRQFTLIIRKGERRPTPQPLLDHFGLLYAGACIAIEAGVLPWKRLQVSTALRLCLLAALKQNRAGRLTPKKIRRVLRKHLCAPAVISRKCGTRFGAEKHAGFYQTVDGRRQYTVHARAFRRWFGSSSRCAAALNWLQKKNLLVLGDKTATPSLTTPEWAERTPRWPDGSVQRSFVFKSLYSLRRRVNDKADTVRKAPLVPVPLFKGLPPPAQRHRPAKRRGRPPAAHDSDGPDRPTFRYVHRVGYPPPWRGD